MKRTEINGDDGKSAYRKLFEAELRELYWTENALAQVLPKMIKRASSETLVTALYEQLFFTKEQIGRIESVFRLTGFFPQSKKCPAMEGILKETHTAMKEMVNNVRDTGIIGAAQKVLHYEIASYGALNDIASTLGLYNTRLILQQIINEKRNADSRLSVLSVSGKKSKSMPASGTARYAV
jgi:ferritin-like metal-binding protein YciE